MDALPIQICANGSLAVADFGALPLAPPAVFDDLRACADLGATEFHIHPRDASQRESLDIEPVAAWISAMRRAVPGCTISLSTGEWIAPLEIRLALIARWQVLPDYASVNFHEAGAERIADALIARGIGIEAGVWNLDGAGRFSAYARRRFCRRLMIEIPDTPRPAAMIQMSALLRAMTLFIPEHDVILHGEGHSAWPMLFHAMRGGQMARIGLEDVRVLPDGTDAPSNAALLAAAIRLSRHQGGLPQCA